MCLLNDDGHQAIEGSSRPLLVNLTVPIPGQPFGPGDRRQTDPLDAECDDRVERRSTMLETVVGRALRRRKRLSASDAPVATPFSGCGSVESVADNACGRDVSGQRTRGIETAWFLHGAWALSTTVLWRSNDGPNSSMEVG